MKENMSPAISTNTPQVVPGALFGNAFNAFNVIIRKDIKLQTFVKDYIASQNGSWSVIKDAFKGKDDVRLTIVEDYADTPFRCYMLVSFFKQLEAELGVTFSRIKVYLAPVKDNPIIGKERLSVAEPLSIYKGRPLPCDIPANNRFSSTILRDEYLQCSFDIEYGTRDVLRLMRYSVRRRDAVVSVGRYSLNLRTDNGLTNGWEMRTPGYHPWLTYLHEIPGPEIQCSHRQVRSLGKRGVLLSVELNGPIV